MTGPLRIVICLSHFHPVVGGAERKMQQLAERWARLGHQPQVLTRTLPESCRREVINGVEINRVIRTASVGPAFGATFISSLTTHLLRRARQFDVMLAGQLPWESVATGIVS
ncbi:MAG TPA: glycosyltransferase, partial [Pirellulales bacterium]|nr:glycosyltransferase [Pirellulales bacterium]